MVPEVSFLCPFFPLLSLKGTLWTWSNTRQNTCAQIKQKKDINRCCSNFKKVCKMISVSFLQMLALMERDLPPPAHDLLHMRLLQNALEWPGLIRPNMAAKQANRSIQSCPCHIHSGLQSICPQLPRFIDKSLKP